MTVKWEYYKDDYDLECCTGVVDGYSIDIFPFDDRFHFDVWNSGTLVLRSCDIQGRGARGCTSMDGAKSTARFHIGKLKEGVVNE